ARVDQRFGVKHVIDVLRGAQTDKVRGFRHEQLSTYGLLKDCTQIEVRNWIYQLIGQGALAQDGGERPVLKLNEKSWEVMKKARTVRLLRPMHRQKGERAAQSKAATAAGEGVDGGLLEEMRRLGRDWARDQGVPTYIIFGDATLRDLARRRPSNRQRMRAIYGIGDKKLRDFGDLFLDAIVAHCRQHHVALDVAGAAEGFFPTEDDDRSPAGPADRSAALADVVVVAQKILSCIARLERPCRTGHVVRVLRGVSGEAVRRHGDEKLSTFGLLRDHRRAQVRDWIQQLIEQCLLDADKDWNPVLRLNDASWAVMRGTRAVELRQSRQPAPVPGDVTPLIDLLCEERERLAERRQVAPAEMLADWIWRDLGHLRPSTLEKRRRVSGITDGKLADFGGELLQVIDRYCARTGLPRDQRPPPRLEDALPRYQARAGSTPDRAFGLLRQSATLDDVARQMQVS